MHCRSGLIPAHAGKTGPVVPVIAARGAHPRSRGENLATISRQRYRAGSSPLTRGKQGRSCISQGHRGLIPAHAGKTNCRKPSRLTPRAHPRSRGENPSFTAPPRPENGSSPLTRGKRQAAQVIQRRRRLIPAHAGKTSSRRSAATSRRAHPRSRGENSAAGSPIRTSWGSSPLTRGKRLNRVAVFVNQGLIPAHAGKTGATIQSVSQTMAHPRSRGENGRSPPLVHDSRGSSPLTRGKRSIGADSIGGRGLIPAHAGKTRAI